MRTEYSIKNTITQFVSNILTFIMLFISQSIFVKILGIEYNGLNGLFGNILILLNLFELGIGNSITYNLYKYIKNNDKETIKSIMYFYKKSYIFIALLVFAVGLLIMPFLNYIVKITVDVNLYVIYALFLINIVLSYLLTYKRNLLIASQKNYIINVVSIICNIVLNIVQIIVLYLTKNYYLYLLMNIVLTIVESTVINIIVNKLYPYILHKNIKPLNKEIKDNIVTRVKALVIHKMSAAVTNGTDNILISMFIGIKTVGLYINYNYIFRAVKKLFSGLISSTLSSIGNLLIEDNKEKNYEVFKKIRFLNYWIAVFTSTCLLIITEPFIKIWLGNEYILDKTILIVLIINFFQSMMRSVYETFKDAAGLWVEDKYMPILQLSINLIVSIVLLKLIGLAGVFVGTIISSLVLWLYSFPRYVYKNLFNRNYLNYFKGLFKFIVIFLLILTITYIISNVFIIKSSIFKLIVNGFICIIIPNLILYLLFRKTDEFRYYINLIKNTLRRKKI